MSCAKADAGPNGPAQNVRTRKGKGTRRHVAAQPLLDHVQYWRAGGCDRLGGACREPGHHAREKQIENSVVVLLQELQAGDLLGQDHKPLLTCELILRLESVNLPPSRLLRNHLHNLSAVGTAANR